MTESTCGWFIYLPHNGLEEDSIGKYIEQPKTKSLGQQLQLANIELGRISRLLHNLLA